MDPPAMETELEGSVKGIPGTDQTDPKMLLEAVRHHRIAVGGLLFTPLMEVEHARPL